MPSPDKVSILDRSGNITNYSTYTTTKTAANVGDLIQIWANLNEQIILKDGVDIWIAPGVVLNYTSGETITDNTVACKCKIYGYGSIKNSSSSSYNVCSFINSGSKISLKCQNIENTGNTQTCIISYADILNLECNLVYSNKGVGIWLQNASSSNININITKLITGLINDTNTGSTAIITNGNGFLKVDEIICRNLGHCLNHRGGLIIASIRKLTTTHNYSLPAATVFISQGNNVQELVLYFDEVQSLAGSLDSSSAVAVKQGIGTFIGRRIYADDEDSAIIGLYQTGVDPPFQMNIFCHEIICLNKVALTINECVEQCLIDAALLNAIEFPAVVYSNGYGKFFLKNSKLKSNSSSNDAQGIGVEEDLGISINLKNIKIVSGDSTHGRPIFVGNSDLINIINFGLFTNADVNSSMATLLVGTGLNYQYIQNSDLS